MKQTFVNPFNPNYLMLICVAFEIWIKRVATGNKFGRLFFCNFFRDMGLPIQ